MYRGKSEMTWQPFSVLCSLIANVNRDPKKTKPFTPADFNPWTAKRKKSGRGKYRIDRQTIGMLKVFLN